MSCGLQVHSDDAIYPHASAPVQRRTTGPGSRGRVCMSRQYLTMAILGGLGDDEVLSRIAPFPEPVSIAWHRNRRVRSGSSAPEFTGHAN